MAPAVEGREYLELSSQARRLDSLDLGDVGFIKIDVEGHETEVIDGASELIARCRPIMLVEIEEVHSGKPVRVVINEIERHGYRCFALFDGALTDARQVESTDDTYVFNWIFLPERDA